MTDSLTKLSWNHGVKVYAGSLCSVEEIELGNIVGHSSVKATAHMNKAVVVFLEKVEQVNKLVEMGWVSPSMGCLSRCCH